MPGTSTRAIVTGAIMGLAMGLTASVSVNAAEVTLRLHSLLPPVAAPHKFFLAPWAKKIGEDSGGRIQVDIYPSMQLGGKPPQLVDQVVDGRVDIVWTLPGYTPGRFPKTETFELPGILDGTLAQSNQALWEFYQKNLQEEYKDFHVLLLHTHAGQAFHTNKPIRKAEDLKGLSIRAPSATGTLWLLAAGANPVQAPVPAIPQLLSKNVVDGVMIPFEIVPAFKVHELTKYHTSLPNDGRIHTAVFLFAMNKDSYNNLPDDLKKVIDANSGANLSVQAGNTWTEIEKPGQKMSRDRGNEFIEFSAAEAVKIEAISERAVAKWIASTKGEFDGAALVAEARALIAKYAK